MEYVKIIAVTGLPGLYEMIGNKGDGAIVRSLDDQTTKFVSGRVHNFTHLESIEVYTQRDNVNLAEVLNAMKSSAEKLPDEKDNKALQAYFKKVYPDLDFDRVYVSDMKKMVKWFSALQKNNVDIKLSESEQEPEEELVVEEAVAVVEKEVPKPTKKAKPVKVEEAPKKEKPAEEKTEKPAAKAKSAKAKEEPKKAKKAAKTTKAAKTEAAPKKKTAAKKKEK